LKPTVSPYLSEKLFKSISLGTLCDLQVATVEKSFPPGLRYRLSDTIYQWEKRRGLDRYLQLYSKRTSRLFLKLLPFTETGSVLFGLVIYIFYL